MPVPYKYMRLPVPDHPIMNMRFPYSEDNHEKQKEHKIAKL